MKIHHIGYAVRDLDNSIVEFEMLGYLKSQDKKVDAERKVQIQFMNNGPYRIELISPIGHESPIDNILKKMGDSPYHICYEVVNIEKAIEELVQQKYIVLQPPKEAVAISNNKVTFLYKKGVGLIELVETK